MLMVKREDPFREFVEMTGPMLVRPIQEILDEADEIIARHAAMKAKEEDRRLRWSRPEWN